MRNFYRLAQNVDVIPLMTRLARSEELWNQHRFRTTFENTPHGEVDDILLRFSDPSIAKDGDTQAVMADTKAVWLPPSVLLPEVQSIVLDLMRRVNAYALDRLILTRLKTGGRILPHADNQGEYVHDRDRARFHVVLQGLPGSLYRTGDETVQMLTGEVWWFNALVEHEVQNNSVDDRVHLLVDLQVWPS